MKMRSSIFKMLVFMATLAFVLCLGFPAFAQSVVAHQSPVAPADGGSLALQLKLLAIAGSVYAILQAVKQVLPVTGILAVILNVVLSAIGVAVGINPSQLFSLPTLTAIVISAIGAAGAHGTISRFTDSSGSSSSGKAAGTVAMLAFALTGVMFITGCSSVEVQAYRVIVGAKALTKSVGVTHPECGTRDANDRWQSAHNSAAVCTVLDKSISAKDVLIDLAETYCSGSGFESGGPCNPPTDKNAKAALVDKLTGAISNYEQIETDLKTALK
jgi:hypothetical protein